MSWKDDGQPNVKFFGSKILLAALERTRDLGRAGSASLHALLVRSVRRSALGHTTAPLSALLQPHRAQPDPPTVGVERR